MALTTSLSTGGSHPVARALLSNYSNSQIAKQHRSSRPAKLVQKIYWPAFAECLLSSCRLQLVSVIASVENKGWNMPE